MSGRGDALPNPWRPSSRPGRPPYQAGPEEAQFLADYDPTAFAPAAVVVDVVLLTIRAGHLSVLLIERAGHPYRGAWALPGGFVAPDEDTDAAASRELAEETGLATFPGHLEQLRTYGTPDRDPRMRVVSVAYVGIMPDLPTPAAGSDAANARWWTLAELEADDGPDLAFDHSTIVAAGVERARAKLEYTPLASSFTTEPFTLVDLRHIYEAVWGVELHVGNFRRKVLSTRGFVKRLGVTNPAEGTRGRPAARYRRGNATILHPAMLRPGTLGIDDSEDDL